jgi:hypothetical protein
MRREKTLINSIRNEKGEITTNTNNIQGIIRDYFETLYSNKLENLEEMNKFLNTYDHLKLNQEDINHLNRSITHDKIETGIESPKKKSPGSDRLSTELNQTLKKNYYQHSLYFSMK